MFLERPYDVLLTFRRWINVHKVLHPWTVFLAHMK